MKFQEIRRACTVLLLIGCGNVLLSLWTLQNGRSTFQVQIWDVAQLSKVCINLFYLSKPCIDCSQVSCLLFSWVHESGVFGEINISGLLGLKILS